MEIGDRIRANFAIVPDNVTLSNVIFYYFAKQDHFYLVCINVICNTVRNTKEPFMARAGVYKSEVVRAREKLLAQGIYPSIDAVRAELGNTGSKSTIHRYLKEVEEEEGGRTGTQVAVSEAIMDLAGRLAERLQVEADARIAEAGEAYRVQIAQFNDMIATLQQEAEGFRNQLEQKLVAMAEEKLRHTETQEKLRSNSLERARLGQQVVDFQDRLAAEEAHRKSLEEKHESARQSLEHFRQAAKEQREQEARRHEQQVQQLQAELRHAQQTIIAKQEETSRLNQEGARLITELAHSRKATHEAQQENRQIVQRLSALQAVEQRNGELMTMLTKQELHSQALSEQLATTTKKTEALEAQLRAMELEIAQSQARNEAQQGLVGELRAYLDSQRQPPAPTANEAPPN
jgi:chromosome segregation ATPase